MGVVVCLLCFCTHLCAFRSFWCCCRSDFCMHGSPAQAQFLSFRFLWGYFPCHTRYQGIGFLLVSFPLLFLLFLLSFFALFFLHFVLPFLFCFSLYFYSCRVFFSFLCFLIFASFLFVPLLVGVDRELAEALRCAAHRGPHGARYKGGLASAPAVRSSGRFSALRRRRQQPTRLQRGKP